MAGAAQYSTAREGSRDDVTPDDGNEQAPVAAHAMADTRLCAGACALVGARAAIGHAVFNQLDEKLGEIKEIMLDMRAGEVAYAVLSFGGFLGIGEKLFAVPWSALTHDTLHERFVLHIAKDALSDAPGFDKQAWPDMADEIWAEEIHTFYASSTL